MFKSLNQFDAFVEEISSLEKEAEIAFQAILEIAPGRRFQALTWNPAEARRILEGLLRDAQAIREAGHSLPLVLFSSHGRKEATDRLFAATLAKPLQQLLGALDMLGELRARDALAISTVLFISAAKPVPEPPPVIWMATPGWLLL